MKTKTPIKGIQNNISALNSDGSCTEIINQRNRFGEWETIYPPETIDTKNKDISRWHLHHTSDGEKYYWGLMTYEQDNITRVVNLFGGGILPKVSLAEDEELYNITNFGNIVMVNTSKQQLLFFYSNQLYKELPPVPQARFSINTTDRFLVRNQDVEAPTEGDDWQSICRTEITAAITEQTKEGRTQGHTFFQLAFRTAQGNYIAPSMPIYHYISEPIISEMYEDHPYPNTFAPFYREKDGNGFNTSRDWKK